MATKEVEFDIEGKKVVFKIKELKFGEYTSIIRESTKINASGEGTTDAGKFSELVLYYSIVEPVEYRQNLDKIRELPVKVAQSLVNEALELSGLVETKKKEEK